MRQPIKSKTSSYFANRAMPFMHWSLSTARCRSVLYGAQMIRLLAGDCRDVLATLPADSVHMVSTSPPYYALGSYLDASHADKHREIGSEPTPEAYLQMMVEVFREVRRVLRPDGTCWVNMGDSYSTGGGYSPDAPSNLAGSKQSHNHGSTKRAAVSAPSRKTCS